jgi:hypothetical protein
MRTVLSGSRARRVFALLLLVVAAFAATTVANASS